VFEFVLGIIIGGAGVELMRQFRARILG